jgi:hypothetical protein
MGTEVISKAITTISRSDMYSTDRTILRIDRPFQATASATSDTMVAAIDISLC